MSIIRPTTINARFSQPVGIGKEKLWLCPTLGGDRLDLSGNGNHGTYNGGMGTVGDKYKGSRAYKFDGSNDDVDCNNTISTSSNLLSVSSWFNASSLPTVSGQTRSLVSKGNSSGITPFDLSFRGTGTATLLRFFTYSQATSLKGITTYIANTIDTSYWHHVCGTYDNKTFRLYIDGSQVATSAWAGGLFDNAADVRIGSLTINGVAQRYFVGLQDDVRIFSRALSPSEIKHLASYRGVLGSPRQPYDPLKRTIVRVPAAVPTATKVGSFRKPVTIAKPSYQAGYARNASESENPKLWDGLVGAWMPSLGVTGDTLRDVSGNGNDGTLYDDTHFTPTSKGLALDFDRNGDYVAVPPNDKFAFGGSDFTLLQWVKVRSQAGAGYGLWDTLNLGGIGYRSNSLVLFWSGSLAGYNKLGVFFQGGVRGTSDALPLNTWHLCGVRRRNAGTNGADIIANSQKYQFTCNVSLNTSSNVFGRVSDSSYWLDGRIASSQIWNRALSDAEIKQLYVDSLAPFRKKQRVSVVVPAATPTPSATYHPLRSLAHPLEQ